MEKKMSYTEALRGVKFRNIEFVGVIVTFAVAAFVGLLIGGLYIETRVVLALLSLAFAWVICVETNYYGDCVAYVDRVKASIMDADARINASMQETVPLNRARIEKLFPDGDEEKN